MDDGYKAAYYIKCKNWTPCDALISAMIAATEERKELKHSKDNEIH